MEEIIKESARQAPALAILLVLCIAFARAGMMVVRSFLAQLTEMRNDQLAHANQARTEYLKAIERLHSDNMEARAANRLTIAENTTANDKQSTAIIALTMEVRELRAMISPLIRRMQES